MFPELGISKMFVRAGSLTATSRGVKASGDGRNQSSVTPVLGCGSGGGVLLQLQTGLFVQS